MLDRARSLEDARAKQIAPRLPGILRSCAAQRRYPARSDLLGRDDAEIGSLYPRLGRRRRPQLRHPARKPAGQSALDQQPDDRRRRRPRAVRDAQLAGRPRSQRPGLSQEGAGDPRLRLQRFPVRHRHRPADHDGGLSGVRDQRRFGCRHRRRHQSRLDVEDHGQSRRPARHFGGADRQRGHRAGGAGGSGQHDRPCAGYDPAVVRHRRQGDRFGPGRTDRFRSSRPTAPNAPSTLRAFPAPNRA